MTDEQAAAWLAAQEPAIAAQVAEVAARHGVPSTAIVQGMAARVDLSDAGIERAIKGAMRRQLDDALTEHAATKIARGEAITRDGHTFQTVPGPLRDHDADERTPA